MKGLLLQHWHCDACAATVCTESVDQPPSGWLFQMLADEVVHACSEECARELVNAPLLGWRVSASASPGIPAHGDVVSRALQVPELSRAAIPTYALLCQIGLSSPSMAELASRLRIDRRNVKRHVRHLERVDRKSVV